MQYYTMIIQYAYDIQRIAHALTIEDLDDLLADEVLDFIIIDYSLFKDRETKRENKRANIN